MEWSVRLLRCGGGCCRSGRRCGKRMVLLCVVLLEDAEGWSGVSRVDFCVLLCYVKL